MIRKISYVIATILALLCLTSTVMVEAKLPPLIRLHVLANSDSARDQALKLLVRDKILEEMNQKFSESKSLTDSRRIVLDNLSRIEAIAKEALRAEGIDYPVRALYGIYEFPTRYYGGFALPAGRYEALRVVIGQGEGTNWWCVLFPPLCLVDGDAPENEKIKEIAENIQSGKVIKVKPAFKVVELWNKLVDNYLISVQQ